MLQKTNKITAIALIMVHWVHQAIGQTYYFTSPQGYGSGVTGGGAASPTIVTSQTALQSALTASGNGVVIVSGTISCSYMSLLINNKTLLGLPGARLRNLDQTASGSGIMNIKEGSSNVIIRNLIFEGPGAYDVDGRDNLTNSGGNKIWVDHCEFQDGTDGNFDNKNTADNITISWCKFTYLKPPKSGGSGGSNDHRFSNLVGSSDKDMPSDGKYSITWQYCWWAQGCVERMCRARNAQLHMLNCYWNSTVANVALGLGGTTDCYVENSVFANTGDKYRYYDNGEVRLTSVNSENSPTNVGTCPAPTYSRESFSAGSLVSAITGACGAGATLNVTSSGSVSVGSGCGILKNQAPVVSISSPLNDAIFTIPASISINANATDSDGNISKVDFFKGSTLLGTDNTAPYSFTWTNVVAGTYIINVMATDNDGATTTATITVTVSASSCEASISTSGNTSFCQGGNVTLSANSGMSYVWKNGNTQVGVGGSYIASNSGIYTVEVTQANGCKAISIPTSVSVSSPTTWYADTDDDGLGDSNISTISCMKPTGYVSVSGDLCPYDANKSAPGSCGCGKSEGTCVDCAGKVNGAAIFDNCARCIGGTTGLVACNAIVQAENSCEMSTGSSVDSDATKSGFLGTGFVNTPNTFGAYTIFGINASVSNVVTVGFRYGNSGTVNRSASLTINGGVSAIDYSFVIDASSPTYWNTEEKSGIAIPAGNSLLKLTATNTEGLANLDFMYIIGSQVSQGTCLVTSVDENHVVSNFILFPNPANGEFNFEMMNRYELTVMNASGDVVENISSSGLARFGLGYAEGLYFVKVAQGKEVHYIKVVKE